MADFYFHRVVFSHQGSSLSGQNNDDDKFNNDLFLRISSLPGKHIIAGDFNCVLDPKKR